MYKIVLIGPESTGKTTLARALADFFETVWVKEYAREYLNHLKCDYVFEDLEKIAKGQIESEEQQAKLAKDILVCDTDLIVIKVWSEFIYQSCSNWILNTIQHRQYDLYVLCGIDVPWEADPLREHPDAEQRQELYNLYKKALQDYGKTFIEVRGTIEERLRQVVDFIKKV